MVKKKKIDFCAEREQETNKRFFGNYKERISRFLFSCRIKMLFWRVDRYKYLLYKKHCKKGFHAFSPQTCSWEQSAGGKKTVKVKYHNCRICDTKIFMTPQDKIKYQKLKSGKNKWFKEFFGKNYKKVK